MLNALLKHTWKTTEKASAIVETHWHVCSQELIPVKRGCPVLYATGSSLSTE